MSINIVPTKVIIPKRTPGVVRRPRLLDFLHENLERKLLLVTAPAGYGKTTLLVDFASDVDFPVCWYTLDEGDRDPSTFMAHLVASIRQKFPKFGERSMSMSEGGMLVARSAAAALVTDMVNEIPEYFVLVLDDWHLVGEDATIRELLDQLLHYLPEHAHVVVAGRTLPRGPLIRLTAQGDVAGLGPGNLRFTPGEVREVLAGKYDLQISEEQAIKLVEESEGWITGILLTSQAMWQGLLAGLIHAAGAPGALYDYLAGEVFDRLSPPLRRFLLESAVPRQFTAQLCDELRNLAGSGVWIDQVESHSLFLTRVDVDSETWYQYHHLFRDFLLTRFKRDDPAGFARLQIQSGELFESRQQPEEAVEHYLAASAPVRAARVMDASARSLYIAGRHQTLRRWVELLPTDIQPTVPELLLYHGQVLSDSGHGPAVLPILELADQGFTERGDSLGRLRAELLKGWVSIAHGSMREALAVGERVLERLDELGVDEPVWRGQALRLIGSSFSAMGQWASGENYLAQALVAYRRTAVDDRRNYNLGRTLNDLAYALRFMGRLEEAAALQVESLALWRKIGNPSPLAGSLNNAGYDRHLVGDYEGALSLYKEALANAEEAEDRRFQAWVSESIAAVHRDSGDIERSIEIYEEVFAMANEVGDQSLVCWTLEGMGHAHRLSGHLDRAMALFEQAWNIAERESLYSQVTMSLASIGVTQAEQGLVLDGIGRLESAVSALRKSDSHVDLARTLFWLGRAYYVDGQHALARQVMAELSRTGERLGCRPFSLAEGRRALSFLDWSANHFETDTRLRVWIVSLSAKAVSVSPVAEAQIKVPIRLEVRALGTGQVTCNDHAVSATEWGGSAIARELFFYLCERSPQQKEEIGAVFWPDLTSAKMTNAFHAAKYRVRRALGVEFVLYEDDCYRIDPALDFWYDVAEFEKHLDSAQHRRSDDPARQADLQFAVSLYTSDYLRGTYSDWAQERQSMLRGRYFDALSDLVGILTRQEHFERALELCQRGIELDDYREDLHRTLMWCLAKTGRRAEALVHYRTLARRLRKDLRASPAPETQELMARIRAQS